MERAGGRNIGAFVIITVARLKTVDLKQNISPVSNAVASLKSIVSVDNNRR